MAADGLLLVAQRRAVPDLDQHADAPRDEVGPVAQPRRLARPVAGDPDVARQRVGVLGLEVGRAVLEAHEVARRGLRAAGRCDVRPKPSCDQRTVTAPRPMRARLRTAWKATCGSSAHACTHRSPPLRSGSSSSPGSAGSVAQRRRAPARRARSARRTATGPSPKVTVRRAGVEAQRLAGVLRRRERPRWSASPTASPGGHPRAPPPTTSRSSSRRSAARRPSSTSKAAKCRRSCAGVAMPGLVGARGRRPSARPRRPRRRRSRGRARSRRRRRDGDPAAPRPTRAGPGARVAPSLARTAPSPAPATAARPARRSPR